jgi:hypothetical protein
VTAPIPPETSRADVLGRLNRERWFAADAKEYARVEQLDAQIARLSAAASPSSPLCETTAAAPVRKERAASATPKSTAATNAATLKGTRRVRTR